MYPAILSLWRRLYQAPAPSFGAGRGQHRYNYLRRPLPPRIPPRIPRAICRPIELLAARIALFTIEVANES